MNIQLRLLPLAISVVLIMLAVKAYEIGREIKLSANGFSIRQSQAIEGDTEPLRLLQTIKNNLASPKMEDLNRSVSDDDAVGGVPLTVEGYRAKRVALAQIAEGKKDSIEHQPKTTTDTYSKKQLAQAEFGGITESGATDRAARARKPGEAGAASSKPLRRSDVLANIDEMTKQELGGLLRLQDRRTELQKLEGDLNHRRRLLQAAEQRVDEKISELNNLKFTIEELLDKRDLQQEEKTQSLVKIYESMKPKDAAKIFNELAMPVLLDVVDKMNERKLAPVLGKMDPGRARNITEELLQRRVLPIPKE